MGESRRETITVNKTIPDTGHTSIQIYISGIPSRHCFLNDILHDPPFLLAALKHLLLSTELAVVAFVDLKRIHINAAARPNGPIVIQRFVFAITLRERYVNGFLIERIMTRMWQTRLCS